MLWLDSRETLNYVVRIFERPLLAQSESGIVHFPFSIILYDVLQHCSEGNY